MSTLKNTRIFICLLVLLIWQQAAYAGGFRLPEYTAAGVATANALVADTTRMSAIAYNPAIMSTYSTSNPQQTSLFSGSLIQVQYDTEVSTASKTTQGTGQSTFNIPGLFISERLSDKLSVGLLVHSPFGLETKWPTNTFPAFGGVAAVEPELSRIKMFNANINLGYRLNANTGIAIGVNRYQLLDLRFNSQATAVEGDGSGYGWNTAFITKMDKLTLGLSYRSKVQANATGMAGGVTPIKLDVTFPEMLTIGANYAVNDALTVELDIEHTGWKVYDNLNIRRAADNSTLTLSTNNWKNTLTYRASAQYKTNKHQFLFGYAYDETPQSDDYFSARVPDSDRQLFSVGYQYDFGTYQIETGLMLVKFKDRVINSSKTYVLASPPNEPNGSTAYNGTYRSNAVVLSVGVNVAF